MKHIALQYNVESIWRCYKSIRFEDKITIVHTIKNKLNVTIIIERIKLHASPDSSRSVTLTSQHVILHFSELFYVQKILL